MNRLSVVVLLLILGGAAVETQAQAPAAPAPASPAAVPKPPAAPGNKMATIQYMKAVLESDPGKAAQQKGEKELAPEQAMLEKLSNEITALETKLKNAKTDAEKSAVTRDIEAKNREGQRVQEDGERKRADLREKLLKPIASMVDKALDEYAKANGVALIVDPSMEPTNIVYANTAMDVTSEIMRAVNAAYAKDPKLADPAATPEALAAPATK